MLTGKPCRCRVIGKGGETIKALQQYTGAMIQVGTLLKPGVATACLVTASVCSHGTQSSRDDLQIDQSVEPTRVTIAGSAQSLQLALCMVRDIVAGNFKVWHTHMGL